MKSLFTWKIHRMMPHIHFLFGMTYLNFLELLDPSSLDTILFLIGSLSPDLDFILAYKLKSNHRRFATHYPLFWLLAFVFTLILRSPLLWFFWGGFLHLILDTLDWEVLLLGPFFSFSFSFLSLEYKENFKNLPVFRLLTEYYSDKRILILEGIFFLLYFLSLLTV